jgi:hypothetical protein
MPSKWEGIIGNDGSTIFDWSSPQSGASSLFAGKILIDASSERLSIDVKNGSSAYTDYQLSNMNFIIDILLGQWSDLFSQYRNLNSSDLDTWDGSFSATPPVNPQVYAIEQIEIYTGVGMQLIKDFYINGGDVFAVSGIFATSDFLKYAYLVISSMKDKLKVPNRGGYGGNSFNAWSSAEILTIQYNAGAPSSYDDENTLYSVVSKTPNNEFYGRKYTSGSRTKYSMFNRPFHVGTTGFNEGAVIIGLSPKLYTKVILGSHYTDPSNFNNFDLTFTEGEDIITDMPLNSNGTGYTASLVTTLVSSDVGAIVDTFPINTEGGFSLSHDFISYYVDDSSLLDYYTP